MTIYGADGLPKRWMPKGYVDKEGKSPVISLSPTLQQFASDDEEVAKFKEKQRNRHRCPLCGCPYESKKDMAECAQQPVVRDISNFLGFQKGEIVFFRVSNPDTKFRKDIKGVFVDWALVRTPRGHEEMPAVEWRTPKGVLLNSVLIPDEDGTMTAFPFLTSRAKNNT